MQTCVPLTEPHRPFEILLATQLVSWYFEPSQPQRITSGLKKHFNLSSIYSSHVIKPQIKKKKKFSPDTNLHNKTYTNVKQKFFEGLVPMVLSLLTQHIKLGHAGHRETDTLKKQTKQQQQKTNKQEPGSFLTSIKPAYQVTVYSKPHLFCYLSLSVCM